MRETYAEERQFNERWQSLAEGGHCDQLGGKEWARVLREWIAAGRPPGITMFILDRANIDALGRGALEASIARLRHKGESHEA